MEWSVVFCQPNFVYRKFVGRHHLFDSFCVSQRHNRPNYNIIFRSITVMIKAIAYLIITARQHVSFRYTEIVQAVKNENFDIFIYFCSKHRL